MYSTRTVRTPGVRIEPGPRIAAAVYRRSSALTKAMLAAVLCSGLALAGITQATAAQYGAGYAVSGAASSGLQLATYYRGGYGGYAKYNRRYSGGYHYRPRFSAGFKYGYKRRGFRSRGIYGGFRKYSHSGPRYYRRYRRY